MNQSHILMFLLFFIFCALVEVFRKLKLVLKSLEKIANLLKPVEGSKSFKFYQIKNGQKVRLMKMELSGKEKLAIAVSFEDDYSNAAPVQAPSMSLSDASMGDLVVAADGLSAECQLNGKAGSLKILVDADADLGEGVVPVHGESEEIIVLPGMASKVKVVAVKVEMAPLPEA